MEPSLVAIVTAIAVGFGGLYGGFPIAGEPLTESSVLARDDDDAQSTMPMVNDLLAELDSTEGGPLMQIVRIYTDDDGESHFGDEVVQLSPVSFAPPAPPLNVSSPTSADQMVFIGVPAAWHGDWHPAPRRQYWVGISGELDVTVSDGETRRFGPGSVLLLEDLTGRGHLTQAVGSEAVYGLFVQTPVADLEGR